MAENSAIEWTTHTFNPWMGCTKVSPACAHCYAERDMDKWLGKVKWGPSGTRVMTGAKYWNKPLKWNRDAEKSGTRARVFCASLADVFEDWGKKPINDHRGFFLHRCRGCDAMYAAFSGDTMCNCHCRERDLATLDDLRRDLFKLIDATPHLDWLLLTKRPENIRRMLVPHCLDKVAGHVSQNTGDGYHVRQRPNVWLGVSVENQEYAERRIPELLRCRELAPVLFLSCEPLLGPITLLNVGEVDERPMSCLVNHPCVDDEPGGRGIDWVIAGGESGDEPRPSHPEWFRSLRDQCQAAGVPFLFKQWGEWLPDPRMFQSDTHWANKAPGWVGKGDYCLDRAGLHCQRGGDFSRAEYPVAIMTRVGKKAAGRLLDGCEHNGFPEGVRV